MNRGGVGYLYLYVSDIKRDLKKYYKKKVYTLMVLHNFSITIYYL